MHANTFPAEHEWQHYPRLYLSSEYRGFQPRHYFHSRLLYRNNQNVSFCHSICPPMQSAGGMTKKFHFKRRRQLLNRIHQSYYANGKYCTMPISKRKPKFQAGIPNRTLSDSAIPLGHCGPLIKVLVPAVQEASSIRSNLVSRGRRWVFH